MSRFRISQSGDCIAPESERRVKFKRRPRHIRSVLESGQFHRRREFIFPTNFPRKFHFPRYALAFSTLRPKSLSLSPKFPDESPPLDPLRYALLRFLCHLFVAVDLEG
ncbi:hypothetical protein CMV_000201 [Castanea mollissima]|uniref:Uncharacterized protein n=1 Tax=Castanea mollissima TaxID=60419 RepID=A0A8J4RTP8_9ROSI|nr:hypothetical protein CMV_000201 [Castanea mollissima]